MDDKGQEGKDCWLRHWWLLISVLPSNKWPLLFLLFLSELVFRLFTNRFVNEMESVEGERHTADEWKG